jgi:integrase
VTDEPNKAGKPAKKKPRRSVGQRTTIIASKKYFIRVFLCKDSAGRKRYHNETVHGTAAQADDRIREVRRRHLAGEAIKANADTFGSFLDEWIEAKKLSVAESSHKTYKQTVEKHIRPALGSKMLVTVTADDVQRFYGKLHDDGLDLSFIRSVHTVLGMVFKLAVKRKKLMGSPMAGVEIPKAWGQAEDEAEDGANAMTAEQVAQFLEAAKGERLENLFKLAFFSGFRPGELLGLKWADFDQKAKTLRVNQSIVWRKAGDWYLKKPKTKKSRRTLPLTDEVVAVLQRQRTAQLEAKLKAGKLWVDHGFVFADSTGEPFPQWTLLNDCKRILRRAKLPETFTSYTLRHTLATLLLASGENPKAVSERMGHARITVTLDAYAHVLPGMQEGVSEKVERLLKGQK